jgi:serine/threonine-protein kinase
VARHQEGQLSEDFPVLDRLAPGTRVAGYLVEEPLGAGGMAVVYRARDERLRRPVALKVLAPALAADEEFRRRFTAESRAAAAVDHPHIIPVYEAGQAGLALFIAMRLVTGGDLRQVPAREGPLPPERAAVLLSPVASALDAAHAAGLVHRDVKPGNVLVDSAPGRPEHVYLSDFGISKGAASSAGLTGTGQYLGTPDYTSPEQVRGLAVDGRTDQYALACVAWLLLTGTVPFQRDDPMDVLFAHLHAPLPSLDSVRPGLPAAAGPVLARALAKEPGERYPSCGEFTDALRDALGLPPYRPAAPPADVAGTAAPWHPGTLAAEPDGPTRDVTASGQRPAPARSPDTAPGRPARRRRVAALALGGTLVAAATAVTLLLASPGAAKPPAGTHGGAAPTASVARTESAAPSGTRTATPAASAVTTQPAVPSRPLTGTLSATLANPQSQGVRAVAFSPDGTTLAVGNFANTSTSYLWDVATRQITATLTGTGHTQINAVAFSPDGTAVADGDFGGDTYVWDTAISKITFTFADPGSMNVDALAFSPDNFTLAVGDGNGCTFLWDTRNGKNAATHCDPLGGGVDAVAFSPNGATLAVGAGAGSTYLWSTATGKLTATLTLAATAAQVQSVAFAPDNTTLAAGDINGNTYLWDTATGKITATLHDPASKSVNSVAFSPDGTSLAVGDINGNTYLWDIATGKITATLHDPASQGVLSVAFSPHGATLAAGDQNGSVYLWRISRRGSS